MGGGPAGNRALLHRFEKRGLGLGGGAIDFIGQYQVGENRARLEFQSLAAAVVGLDDHAADDIGRHQVRRELNSGVF